MTKLSRRYIASTIKFALFFMVISGISAINPDAYIWNSGRVALYISAWIVGCVFFAALAAAVVTWTNVDTQSSKRVDEK